MVGGGWQQFCFSPETGGWGQKCETGRCHGEVARSVLAKVGGVVFALFHAVSAKLRSRTQNSQFCLLGQILCAQSPWCQRKWRSWSWDCFSPVWPFFGLWWRGAFPLGGLSLCLGVVTVNPALITSDDPRQERFIRGKLTKFSGDIDALLLLVRCQDPGHKFCCDMVHAQFFCQNPLAFPITNFHLLSNVAKGPTSILTDELLNSCNSFRSCATCGSPCVFVVNWCATGLDRACHWNTCVRLKLWSPKPCWIISRVSVALFPRFAQNLMHTRCSFLCFFVLFIYSLLEYIRITGLLSIPFINFQSNRFPTPSTHNNLVAASQW